MTNIFIDNKYTKTYYAIISDPDTSGFTEKHHIIPESLFKKSRRSKDGDIEGNPNDPSNIVTLSLRQHKILHMLLPKMVSSHRHIRKMIHAFIMMSKTRQGIWLKTSRMYEAYKTKLRTLPKRTSHYNELTDTEIRLFDGDAIPDGYVVGGRPKSDEHKQRIGQSNVGKGSEKHRISSTGRKHYVNTATGETAFTQDVPDGPNWINGTSAKGQTRGKQYTNTITGAVKAFMEDDDVPDGWVLGNHSEKKKEIGKVNVKAMHNKETADKIRDSKSIGYTIYHDPITLDEITCAGLDLPPENFIKGRSPKNIRYGSEQTDHQKQRVKETMQGTYLVVWSNGTQETIVNLTKFIEYQFPHKTMSQFKYAKSNNKLQEVFGLVSVTRT